MWELTTVVRGLWVKKLKTNWYVLQTFVEGVKGKMAQGVKAEEVGFQIAFSKTELRKVIKEYTGKEVGL